MNQYIEVTFRANGKALPLKRQLPGGQIEFDETDLRSKLARKASTARFLYYTVA